MHPTETSQNRLLDSLIRSLTELEPAAIPKRRQLLALQWAWGNFGYMASSSYLKRIASSVRKTQGPILECGSGLSTIIMAAMTAQNRTPLVALEHHEAWKDRVQAVLDAHHFEHATVIHAPLKDHGDYHWYDVDASSFATPFGLVICDGPPGNTKGSRYGLVPQMNPCLSEDCSILMDDARRSKERKVMETWKRQYGFHYEHLGVFGRAACVYRSNT